MDKIIQNLMDDYTNLYGICDKEESKKFEKFASFSILAEEYADTIEIEKIVVGESIGIDAICIIVNGRMIESIEEVKDLKSINNYIEAEFIFIQSKTSAKFGASEIGSFGLAVKDCFSEHPQLSHNTIVKEKIAVINEIYSHSSSMSKSLPKCKLYYVCLGKWQDDTNLRTRIATIKEDLTDINLFSEITFVPVDIDCLREKYLSTKKQVSVEVTFANKVTFPVDMPGISEAYIGVLPYSEFRKIIMNEKDAIMANVFYDNIRDFQGCNPVNKGIEETIRSSERIHNFPVFNNGLTIVAKTIKSTGQKVVLDDYQIVNGCQTSHVIYNNRDNVFINDLWIPVKIISTSNDDVINDIIQATNSQTQVKPEELMALSMFQRKIEQYYLAVESQYRLYYERRSKQYVANDAIVKTKVITISQQIKSFAAMFLSMPHKVGRYYGDVKTEIGKKLFVDDHKPIVYYTSGYTYYKLEQMFRTSNVDVKYKKARYYVLYAVPLLILAKEPDTDFNSKNMELECEQVLKVLYDDTKIKDIFTRATNIIEKNVSDIEDRDEFKRLDLLTKIKSDVLSLSKQK